MLPEYEYACLSCKHHFVIQRHLSEEEGVILCPECYGEVRRIWQATPVHYHGHGFYTTDVASEKEFET